MPTPRKTVRYEVRPHPSISGLLTIVGIDRQGPTPLINIGEPALPQLARALNDYLARNPRLAIQPEGETA